MVIQEDIGSMVFKSRHTLENQMVSVTENKVHSTLGIFYWGLSKTFIGKGRLNFALLVYCGGDGYLIWHPSGLPSESSVGISCNFCKC